ncbi:fumarate reductase iron-sulfur subunit [Spirochaetota bacterium]|nr:fumarate reductase iron-sulfur subunit [Spirochaetota bacterium]
MNFTLKVWRQANETSRGSLETHSVTDVSPDISFLEMLDALNEHLESQGKDGIAFSHDCREGICGSCGLMINGRPHGGRKNTTVCQLHMREFDDHDVIVIEPWRARAFPVVKDLVVSRKSFEKVLQAGGYVSVRTGSAPEANSLPIAKEEADRAFLSATCIGCGACVASCKNASAMLFTAAKVNHLYLLPQGKVEHKRRVKNMVEAMDASGFGNCTNQAECSAACPKGITYDNITRLNREYLKSVFTT